MRNMGNMASNEASSIAKKTWKIPVNTDVLRISDWAGNVLHFEAIETSTWAEVAPKLMGRTWAPLRPNLRPRTAKFDPSRLLVGPSRPASFLSVITNYSLGACGSHREATRVHHAILRDTMYIELQH